MGAGLGCGKADQRGTEQELSARHGRDMAGQAVQRAIGPVHCTAFQHVTLYRVLPNQVQTRGGHPSTEKKAAVTIAS